MADITSQTKDVDGIIPKIKQNRLVRKLIGGMSLMIDDRVTAVYFGFIVFVIVLGVIGPSIAPYKYSKTLYVSGHILRNAPPSWAHPLGTNNVGQDILSRLLYGARPSLLTGLLGGALIVGIGLAVGVTAGFVGGRTDDALMRFTDVVYGVPLLPFAIIMVALFGVGFFQSILVIGLLLWRGNARVLRAQVLQIRERPFILAAKASGASRTRIVFKHVLPNVAPMAVLFFSLGVGLSILIQATLSFLGLVNPFVPSWGVMIRNAYNSGFLVKSWWWSMPPGILISGTILSTYLIGREYERLQESRSQREVL